MASADWSYSSAGVSSLVRPDPHGCRTSRRPRGGRYRLCAEMRTRSGGDRDVPPRVAPTTTGPRITKHAAAPFTPTAKRGLSVCLHFRERLIAHVRRWTSGRRRPLRTAGKLDWEGVPCTMIGREYGRSVGWRSRCLSHCWLRPSRTASPVAVSRPVTRRSRAPRRTAWRASSMA